MSVDFTVPALPAAQELASGRSLFYVPVSRLAKWPPLLGYDLIDEDDRALHLLSAEENGVIDEALVSEMVRTVSSGAIPGILADWEFGESLHDLAMGIGDRQAAFNAIAEKLDAPVTDRGERLLFYLDQLVEAYVLWVPVIGQAGERRIVKFEYDEADEPSNANLSRRIARSMSWQPRRKYYVMTHVAPGGSYHLDIEAPPLLQIRRIDVGFVSWSNSISPIPRAHTQIEGQRAHVYIAGGRSSVGLVLLETTVDRRGLVSASLGASVLVGLLCTAMAAWSRIVSEASVASGTVAVLVVVPAVLGIVVLRPRDHPLVAQHVSLLRLVTLTASLLPIIDAVLLLVVGSRETLKISFWVVAALAWVATIGTLVSFRVAGWRRAHEDGS